MHAHASIYAAAVNFLHYDIYLECYVFCFLSVINSAWLIVVLFLLSACNLLGLLLGQSYNFTSI